MQKMSLALLEALLLGTLVSYCGSSQDSSIKKVDPKPVACDPETFSAPGVAPLYVYRGPEGSVPEGVWSLKTPSFGSYMSHVKLEERAPDHIEWFAQFLNEDFKDGEARYRQNLYCNAATATCDVNRQVVVGGELERDSNGGNICKPIMLTEIVAKKKIADWQNFETMLTAFDVRPRADGMFSIYSAYCYKQDTYSGLKLFCEIDTPVDTAQGISQVNWRVAFKNEKNGGDDIKLAEQLYDLFDGKTSMSKEIGITWSDLKDPNNAIEMSCGGPSDLSIPGLFESHKYNNCDVRLKHFVNGRASYLVNRTLDSGTFNSEIGEMIEHYNKFIGDESKYPVKRAGSFYFYDLKCSKDGSNYKCDYKKM